MMKGYTLSEVKPRIFFLDFKKSYDLSMHFLRYQEFYESASPRFRGKPFQILDFMEWYSAKYGKGAFTYPVDWAGFNIPDHIITEVWAQGIMDRNIYDYEMKMVHQKCAEKYPNERFYIIGAVGKSFAMKHEIAHGFFYTQPEYREKMTALVKALKPALRKSINKTLKKIGYTPKVYIDECQAYMSTGFTDAFGVKLKDEHKPFVKLYNEYYKAEYDNA